MNLKTKAQSIINSIALVREALSKETKTLFEPEFFKDDEFGIYELDRYDYPRGLIEHSPYSHENGCVISIDKGKATLMIVTEDMEGYGTETVELESLSDMCILEICKFI